MKSLTNEKDKLLDDKDEIITLLKEKEQTKNYTITAKFY